VEPEHVNGVPGRDLELERQEADRVVTAVTRSVVASPREVAIGAEVAPAVHPEGALAARETGEGRPGDATTTPFGGDGHGDRRLGATG
jgi:hypothetical protein